MSQLADSRWAFSSLASASSASHETWIWNDDREKETGTEFEQKIAHFQLVYDLCFVARAHVMYSHSNIAARSLPRRKCDSCACF